MTTKTPPTAKDATRLLDSGIEASWCGNQCWPEDNL